MVNNINNNGVGGNKAAIYQQKNQQLEQTKLDVTNQSAQSDKVKNVNKDSVALTPQATQLKELQKRISESDAFDKKKVDDIKKAISSGEYEINYDRLATKLAEFEFEL